MPLHIQKETVRMNRTDKSLCAAMLNLLKYQGFKKITVGGLCEEALISRATFYAHYTDKYNLLEYWLTTLKADMNIKKVDKYETLERMVNELVSENKVIIKNLLSDADREALNILFDFILSCLSVDTNNQDKANSKYIVLSNFFAGGMIYYLSWHVENKFTSEVMNTFLYDLINNFQEWGLAE